MTEARASSMAEPQQTATVHQRSVLWIGRMRFFQDIRIREAALLPEVCRRANVFALDRTDATGWSAHRVFGKITLRAQMALAGWKEFELDGVTHFRMPIAVGTGPVFNRVSAAVNERMVSAALERFHCDTVFHSNQFLFLPAKPGRRSYHAHFDLVDNFIDCWPDTMTGRARRSFFLDALRRSDSLTAISHTLCDRVEEEIGRRPAYVPNGVHLEEIRRWPPHRADLVRDRHSLHGCVALVYIGNHMYEFDGMDMLLDAFLEAHKVRPELRLLLVGPGSERVPRMRGIGVPQGIHVVGPVPLREVWDYFHVADLGLLPFVQDPGTHACLPLKVLEFGGALKPVLATPLQEMELLALPHVRFAPFDAGAWTRALLDPATYEKPEPASVVQSLTPFTWESAGRALVSAMGL